MREVIACGYIGLAAPDLGEWREFADAVGMMVAEESTDDMLYVRTDDRAYRLCIERGPIGPSNGVNYVGWEVASSRALDAIIDRLTKNGIEIREDEAVATERRVDRLAHCVDPGGHRVEFFVSAMTPRMPFASPTGTRFVTRSHMGDLGLGHVVVTYSDVKAASHFYMDLLGFRLSDCCLLPDRWIFAHCNPRHHSLAYAQYAGDSVYHHFMVEVADLDMVGTAHDRLTKNGARFTTTLGKHNNDHVVSFYVKTPSGLEVEIGCGGLLVDDATWTVTTFEGASVWGHSHI